MVMHPPDHDPAIGVIQRCHRGRDDGSVVLGRAASDLGEERGERRLGGEGEAIESRRLAVISGVAREQQDGKAT